MSPTAIAARGLEEELDMMALSDHNAVGNLPAFFCACEAAGIVPLGGIEVTSEEEAHVLCLFPDLEKARTASAIRLPSTKMKKFFTRKRNC